MIFVSITENNAYLHYFNLSPRIALSKLGGCMQKKMILIGASGTIGNKIRMTFMNGEYEIIPAGKSNSPYLVNMEDVESIIAFYKKVGKFDALVCAAGDVALAPFKDLNEGHWNKSLNSKLMGQVNLVTHGIDFINDNGSITLVSGIASEYPILGGVSATVANRAVEAYVFAASAEMPRGIRINVVSPNMLVESEQLFAPFFPGMKAVSGSDVANAFKKSVMGIQTGQTFRVHY